MKAVILHGGNGTRLRPLTYTDVKQLLPIAGRPISEYALLNLVEIGITEINIIVGEVGEKEVRDYYGNGSKWGVNVTYTYQNKPLGIAHAVGLVRDFIGNENFVVLLGDNYFRDGLLELAKSFNENDYDCLIALTEVANPSQFGIAEVKEGKIVSLVEKPKEPKSNLAITGAYFLTPSIFPIIDMLRPSWRNELEITEAFQIMLEKGGSIGYSIISSWWKDTGTVEEFLDCNKMVLDKLTGNKNSALEGLFFKDNIIISGTAHINKNSLIKGPSYIGENTVIEDSIIGPYTSIGSNCKITRSKIISSVIMDGCRVSTNNKIKIIDSILGPDVVIKPHENADASAKLVLGRDSKVEF